MTWPTHALFGINMLWLLFSIGPETLGYDIGTSLHRGLLHSLCELGMAAVTVAPAALWLGRAPIGALLLGCASHLGADALTKSGRKPLSSSTRTAKRRDVSCRPAGETIMRSWMRE